MRLFPGKRPNDLGVRNGRLKPPPPSPNAVHSQVTEGYHATAPLRYQGTREAAMRALAGIVRGTPRVTIVTQTAEYLYAEYQTALLGFVDDVEFWFPPDDRVIHVRSASRLGSSDFGVNRQRIEEIRARLAAGA